MSEKTDPRNVIEALLTVKRKIDAMGVGKEQRVQDGPARYAYRGVDDVINVISSMLTDAGIVTSVTYHNHVAEDVSIVTQKGTRHAHRVSALQRVKFHFSNKDGDISTLETEGLGEGLDNGDKATNKAMSVAYKYCLGLSFPIPFVGRDDPDAEQPQLAAQTHGADRGLLNAEVVDNYLSQIAASETIDVLRGITDAGIKEAKRANDREAAARIRQAGIDRAAEVMKAAENSVCAS